MTAIGATFFKHNRQQLHIALSGGVVVIAGYTTMQLSGDAEGPFQQEANFWYLTGIEEPDWSLIIADGRHFLVAPNMTDIQRVFMGGISFEAAIERSGADKVLTTQEANDLLRSLAKRHSVAYTIDEDTKSGHHFTLNPAPKRLKRTLVTIFSSVLDCRLELARMRAIKQSEELNAIRAAIRLTAKTFTEVRQSLNSFRYEYEIEAEFSYAFRKSGAAGHAYAPIVAGGSNACTLHYGANAMRLAKNGLVLLDIGARVDGYAADITRTYGRGVPSKREKEVYAAVRAAHLEIIALLSPGLSIGDYHEAVDLRMKEAIYSLGLISSLDDNEGYRRYFPHAVSHGLGIDVHDSLGRPTEFKSGMVLTVEPGIYIQEEGIGVRIEDDILITGSGYENLSKKLPIDL